MVFMMLRACAAVARPARFYQTVPSQGAFLVRHSFAHACVQRFRAFSSTPTSTSAAAASSSQNDQEPQQHVYQAPMARAVRIMKGVSVSSCFLTSVGMPILCYVNEQSVSVIGKWAMCGTIMLFGLGTTSLYHALFEPYVLRMWVDQKSSVSSSSSYDDDARVTVETVTLLAQRTTRHFQLSDVTRPVSSMHPMVSFRANDRNYYIHPEILEDEQLVKKLMGADFKVIQKAPVKEKDDDEW